jgi:hypothetical protein
MVFILYCSYSLDKEDPNFKTYADGVEDED